MLLSALPFTNLESGMACICLLYEVHNLCNALHSASQLREVRFINSQVNSELIAMTIAKVRWDVRTYGHI